MDISVIIVSYNSLGFIKECINSLRDDIRTGTGKKISYEIVVVDNDSSDGSLQYLCRQAEENNDIIIIENKNNAGFSKASNKGAGKASGRFLLFLNPDTRILEGNFRGLVEFYSAKEKSGRVGITGAKIKNIDGSLQYSCRSFPTLARQFFESYFLQKVFKKSRIFGSYFLSWWDHGEPREVDWLSGSFMLVKKDVFLTAGGFDRDYFMYSEDSDLCLKLARAGFKNYYFPLSVIEHADSGIASADGPGREANIWKSRRLYFLKNYSALHGRVLSMLYFKGVINRVVLYFILSIFGSRKKNRERMLVYIRALKHYFR